MNVEDRRGGRGLGGGGMKVGGIGAIVLVVAALFFGIDPAVLMGALDQTGRGAPSQNLGPNSIDDETEEFVSVVLADTEEVWETLFADSGLTYDYPSLVLFSGAVRSACGTASSAVGPFYCPGDSNMYLDTDFFRSLANEMGARGDFAAAYVIAHEVGHHVQNQLGIMRQVSAATGPGGDPGAEGLSVRMELQADCFAGVWARQADERFSTLEQGDIEEAMNAASRIGDDALQRQGQGVVVPDSFTHGTSEQRARWFRRGFETANPDECDTFSAADL